VFDSVLDRHELFSLPAALIYDADGKLHKKLEGAVSYEKQVQPLIAEMLKASTFTSAD
jgi:thiol:disulfide interchange protein